MYNYNNCPQEVKNQLDIITQEIKNRFGMQLIGVYLHGSLVLDAFEMNNSDVDILVIINSRLDQKSRIDLAEFFIKINCKPCTVEISIIAHEHFVPFIYPTPCQFHFSEFWLPKYQEFIKNNDLSHWILATDFPDSDIACHTKLTQQKGICLYGKAINEYFPMVSEENFWHSITYDIDDLKNGDEYSILTLCRIYYYKLHKEIISKYHAGIWGIEFMPQFKNVLEHALNKKFGVFEESIYTKEQADEFVNFIILKINF